MWSCYRQRHKSIFEGLEPKACPGYSSHLLHSAEFSFITAGRGQISLASKQMFTKELLQTDQLQNPSLQSFRKSEMPSALPPTPAQLPKLTYRIITVMFYSHWEKKIISIWSYRMMWNESVASKEKKKSLLKVALFPPSSLSQAPFTPLPQQ